MTRSSPACARTWTAAPRATRSTRASASSFSAERRKNLRRGDAYRETDALQAERVISGGSVMPSTRFETPASAETTRPANGRAAAGAPVEVAGAAHQAFWLLRVGFTVAPILFGLDKFFNWSVHWPDYL